MKRRKNWIEWIFHCRNIIDVAAMDSHNLEPQELNDRIRMYSHKLSQQWGNLQEDSTSVSNGNDYLVWKATFLSKCSSFGHHLALISFNRFILNFRFIERYSKQRSRTFTVGYSNHRGRSPFGTFQLYLQLLNRYNWIANLICFFLWQILFFRFEISHKSHTWHWMILKLSTKKIWWYRFVFHRRETKPPSQQPCVHLRYERERVATDTIVYNYEFRSSYKFVQNTFLRQQKV